MTTVKEFNNTWAGDLGKSPWAFILCSGMLVWNSLLLSLTMAEATDVSPVWLWAFLTVFWFVNLSLHIRSYMIRNNLRSAELEARVQAMESIRAF